MLNGSKEMYVKPLMAIPAKESPFHEAIELLKFRRKNVIGYELMLVTSPSLMLEISTSNSQEKLQ